MDSILINAVTSQYYLNSYFTSSLYFLFLCRYNQLLGRHIHSSHQQCPKPHPLHSNNTAFQGNNFAGLG